MRRAAVLAIALALTACSGPSTAQTPPPASPSTGASAAPAPTSPASATPTYSAGSIAVSHLPAGLAGPFGVLVDETSSASAYQVSLVGLDGSVPVTASAAKRAPISTSNGPAVDLPYVSTSLTALYYLDGDQQVRKVGLDNSRSAVAALPVGTSKEATFAVSPDDSRLAFAVLDFGLQPVFERLGLINLSNGVETDIFSSSSDYVWPVAWHAGLLVLAHAAGPYEADIKAGAGRANPYSAISYHLVEPDSAQRIVLMGRCTVSGPLTTAGTACVQGASLGWDGSYRSWGASSWATVSSAASLSPDGGQVAAAEPNNPGVVAVWRADGVIVAHESGSTWYDWGGWIDDSHYLTGSTSDPAYRPQLYPSAGGPAITVAVRGYFAARLPTPVS